MIPNNQRMGSSGDKLGIVEKIALMKILQKIANYNFTKGKNVGVKANKGTNVLTYLHLR